MHNGVRKVIDVTDRNVIFVYPDKEISIGLLVIGEN